MKIDLWVKLLVKYVIIIYSFGSAPGKFGVWIKAVPKTLLKSKFPAGRDGRIERLILSRLKMAFLIVQPLRTFHGLNRAYSLTWPVSMQIYGNKKKYTKKYTKKWSKSHKICLKQQYGRRFIVLEHQYGCHEVIWMRSDNVLGSAHEKFGVWTGLESGSTIAFYQTPETSEDLPRDKSRSSHETN